MQAHVYAGFLGGMASSAALQPLDLLKTRMQQQSRTGILDTIRSIRSVGEVWRGTLPSVIRTSVGAGLYLGLLNKLRAARSQVSSENRLSTSLPKISAIDNVLTGAFARSVIGLVMMPITVVKIRFESSFFNYKSIWDAFKDICSGPTGFRGLFSGYGATVSRDAPYAGIYMLFYESSKDLLQSSVIPGPAVNSVSAMNAAVLASTVTAPFDTIKTRIQIAVGKLSFLDAAKQITSGGYHRLFDGLSLRLARKALSAGISWGIYEEIVNAINRASTKLN